MPGNRKALLIATDTYREQESTSVNELLGTLRAPVEDVKRLAELLADPSVGAYEVIQSVNQPVLRLRTLINQILDDASGDDVVLLYITGHAMLDVNRRLHVIACDTDLSHLRATSLEARFIRECMDDSRAGAIVLLLDCCYSGAFPEGAAVKAALAADAMEQVTRQPGRGKFIMTASRGSQYAFESTDEKEGATSVFTGAILAGLRTGDADLDQDGEIGFDELYKYVTRYVERTATRQTPTRVGRGVGDVVLAWNPRVPRSAAAPGPEHALVRKLERQLEELKKKNEELSRQSTVRAKEAADLANQVAAHREQLRQLSEPAADWSEAPADVPEWAEDLVSESAALQDSVWAMERRASYTPMDFVGTVLLCAFALVFVAVGRLAATSPEQGAVTDYWTPVITWLVIVLIIAVATGAAMSTNIDNRGSWINVAAVIATLTVGVLVVGLLAPIDVALVLYQAVSFTLGYRLGHRIFGRR